MIYKMFMRNSLDTIFCDSDIQEDDLQYTKMLCNEAFSFQLALGAFKDSTEDWDVSELYLEVESDIAWAIDVYSIADVPAIRVGYQASDDWFLRKTPGIYPDCMQKINGGKITAPIDRMNGVWININERLEEIKSGEYVIEFILYKSENSTGENIGRKVEAARKSLKLEVLDAKLDKQKLYATNWFHYDCMAYFSETEIFSDKFFNVAREYIKLAAKNGQNMILLPAFTPPLDTPIGEERATAQLVRVLTDNGGYKFDFSLMHRFIKLCIDCGIEYFEHNHMYTQWGAEHAPKIIAEENGVSKKIFGWETDAMCREYKEFIRAYLSALKNFIAEHGYEDRFFFHVSDEPYDAKADSYIAVSEFFRAELGDFPAGDALSDYKFYQNGAVQTPIVATDKAEDFLNRAEPLWLYYTGMQSHNGLSNRLLGMPHERDRVLGIQLYYFNIRGFLNWGFNAHHNRLSRKMINPKFSSDMGGDFVGGTSYLVYPTADGAEASVRLMMFRDEMQDIRALEKLECKIGREAVCNLIKKHIPYISMRCRVTAHQILDLRDEVNSMLCN